MPVEKNEASELTITISEFPGYTIRPVYGGWEVRKRAPKVRKEGEKEVVLGYFPTLYSCAARIVGDAVRDGHHGPSRELTELLLKNSILYAALVKAIPTKVDENAKSVEITLPDVVGEDEIRAVLQSVNMVKVRFFKTGAKKRRSRKKPATSKPAKKKVEVKAEEPSLPPLPEKQKKVSAGVLEFGSLERFIPKKG